DAPLLAAAGWQALEALRGHPSTERMPLLVYALGADGTSGGAVELSCIAKPLDSATLQAALGPAPSGPDASRAILVVDDDPGLLDLHARAVARHWPACSVLTATNGRQALAVMAQKRPDLVLLDLMMPELDGFGVLEAMQAS